MCCGWRKLDFLKDERKKYMIRVRSKMTSKKYEKPIDMFATNEAGYRSAHVEIPECVYEHIKTMEFTEDEKNALNFIYGRTQYIDNADIFMNIIMRAMKEVYKDV